jgi:hypothetical protein
MNSNISNKSRPFKRAARIIALAVALAATGCDYYDALYGLYGGFLPDTATIQSVNDYRQSVFENANDMWDAYIRGE